MSETPDTPAGAKPPMLIFNREARLPSGPHPATSAPQPWGGAPTTAPDNPPVLLLTPPAAPRYETVALPPEVVAERAAANLKRQLANVTYYAQTADANLGEMYDAAAVLPDEILSASDKVRWLRDVEDARRMLAQLNAELGRKAVAK